MLTELFEKLALREQERTGGFWKMARKLAVGEKVAPATVERLLTDCGKTLADLKTAVELMQRRRQWFEVVAGVAALEKEKAAIHQRIAVEDRKLEEAERAHAEAMLPLRARLDAIQAALREADDARQRLMDTCPYADLTAELADVVQQIAKLRTRAHELRRTAGECATAAETDLEQIEFNGGQRADYWHSKADEHRRRAETARTELAEVEGRLATLEAREVELRTRMLDP